jgi:hypothetical protein
MQARLALIRFPAVFFAIVFALAAALSLGAVLGYTLKPSFLTPASTQVIVVHEPGVATSAGPGCVWVDKKKHC